MRKLSSLLPYAVVGAISALVGLGAMALQDDRLQAPPGAPRDEPGRPPGPGGPGGPGGFGPGTFLAPQILEAADADGDGRLSIEEGTKAVERLIREIDADKKGSVDAETLGGAINRRLGPPPGVGPDGPPGGPPGGFGPGMFLSPQIIELADANKDGRVSPEEASKAVEKFLREADPKKEGPVDSDTLAGAINRRMGPPPGFGGPGGPMGVERKLVKDYDKDGDGRLNKEERQAARAFLKADREKNPRGGGGPPGGFPGPGPGPGGESEPVKPGPHIDPSEARNFPGRKLYDPDVLRTIFLDFEEEDWEAALTDFHGTDVEVPATLTVDGRKYPDVGVHFRGMSSYFTVREGHKRSLNVSLDFAHADQRLDGYKTLNLLNSHEDPTFLHTVLTFDIARDYIPAPKANLVKVAINGESWGLYVNAQQFDKTLIAENYPSSKGARWKVRGSPDADGGLSYVGDEVEDYKKRYEIKTGDDEEDWKALIALCKTLVQTPPDKLEEALKPILDIDGVLWFLALDNALINGDGYWTRASDYTIYRDPAGKFHVLPHDANETFGPPMMFGPGPGGRPGGRGPGGSGGRGPGGGGPGGPGGRPGGPGAGPNPPKLDLDPLIGMDDPRKPLRGKLLVVPALRERYLAHVRTIAEDWLDWEKLGPVVARYRALIEKDIAEDTRKLTSTEAFHSTVADANPPEAAPRGRMAMSLRTFAEQRRKFLLEYPEIKKLPH